MLPPRALPLGLWLINRGPFNLRISSKREAFGALAKLRVRASARSPFGGIELKRKALQLYAVLSAFIRVYLLFQWPLSGSERLAKEKTCANIEVWYCALVDGAAAFAKALAGQACALFFEI